MKKVIFAVVAVLALGLASCSKTCTCTVTTNGVTSKVTVDEKTLQKANTTCAEYDQVLKLSSALSGGDFSASCKN